MNPLSPPFYVKAKFSYKGTYPEDLVFTKGAILLVREVVAAGEWWKARRLAEDGREMEGEEGNVPQGYFTILKDYHPTPTPLEASTQSGPPPVPLSSRPKTSTLPSPTASSKLNSLLPSASPPPPPSSDPSPAHHPSLKPTSTTITTSSSFRTFPPPQPSNSSPDPPVARNWTPPSRPKPSSSSSASKPSRDSSPAASAHVETAEDEPVFTSLKDRMAALNGRGLSVSGASPPLPPSSSSRPALVARSSSSAHPISSQTTAPPPPPSRRPTSSSSSTTEASSPVPPLLKPRPKLPSSMSSSSDSTRSETILPPPPKAHDLPSTHHPATPSTAPPRLPPRLPPRRPSSNAETSAGGEDSTPASPAPPPPLARRLPPPSGPRSNSSLSSHQPPIPTRLPSQAAQPPTLSSSSSLNPPPPPRRQPNLPPPSALPKPPPRPSTPPPLTSTSLYPHPNAQPLSKQDLAIQTGWFSRQPLTLPSSIVSIRNGRPAASAQFAPSGGPSFVNLGIMYGDRSRTFITISWGQGVPASNPTVEQIHTDPPRRRTLQELEEASLCYGERIARWCEAREGTQVGRGECWDLADQAIKEVGRELNEETGGEHEGLAEAIEHSFGEVVYVDLGGGRVSWGEERRVRRGDVVQFVYATFKSMFSDGSSTTSTAGTPDTGHTAVVVEDWTGIGGAPLKVLQSNVGGSRLTRRGEFSLGDLVNGEVRAFRVMDEEWGGGPARASI